MKFKLNQEEYNLFKKYVDYSEVNNLKYDDNNFTIEIDNKDLRLFQLLVSDASTIYGFDSDGEITEFGRKLESLYDTIYNQSH